MRRLAAASYLFAGLSGATLLAAAAAGARTERGFGTVSLPESCSAAVRPKLELAVARMHSFDGPEDAFAAIGKAEPSCALAWWGAAMASRGNPLAGAPDTDTLRKGRAYLARANAAIGAAGPRDRGLIEALGTYYRDPGAGGHAARTAAYEAAMSALAERFPDDPEVNSVAGLATLEAVDLTDGTFARQLRAAAILERVWVAHPDHPGAPHYLIHATDYTPLAERGLPAAQRYAGIATASVHAQHMPSHIFSMLGRWGDSVTANERAAALIGGDGALCGSGGPPRSAKLDARDPHGLDFIAYARLQGGQDRAVAAALTSAGRSEERTIVSARYVLERGAWAEAAGLPIPAGASAYEEATIRFARAIGQARLGRAGAAQAEVKRLESLRSAVETDRGGYWAGLIDVYGGAASAWTLLSDRRMQEALAAMTRAADLDDGRQKHILLENKLLPMREMLGEMLLVAGQPGPALEAFTASLRSSPNRLRSVAGAARAARALGNADGAAEWSTQARRLLAGADSSRPDLADLRP